MIRRLYLTTLLALQLALLLHVALPLGHALHVDAALGALPHGWPAVAQFASAAVAVIGGALALVFPWVALLRHRQRGELRFLGLPRWAVALALTGATIFALGLSIKTMVPLLPLDARMAAVLTARPALNAGLALLAAGALCAELLRRSVGAKRAATTVRRTLPQRIEVTHPPELSTRAA
jgi:hypothetical protein